MGTIIKLVDVFGQFENQGTGHYYTFLPGNQDAPSGWKTVMKDPRNEVSAGLQYCYATWCTSTDWWIAKVVRNPHDPRGGFAMLSICLGPNRPLEGKKAIEVLDNLARFFITDKHWDDAEAEKALINQEQDFVTVPCALRRFVEPTAAANSAYRNYRSREELGAFLSFLPQSGYEAFSRIFFVPMESTEGMPVKCLDEVLPLKKIYNVVYPNDNSVSSSSMKTELMDGEELVVTYHKAGLEPVEKKIRGGEESKYAHVEGDRMIILSGREIGLVHDRVITVKCRDKDGNAVERFRLSNYTRQFTDVRTNGDKIIVPENFSETIELDIVPSDDKFESCRVKLNLAAVKESTVEVPLTTKAYKVIFRVGSTDFETKETLNPALVRTRWSAYDCEIDNIRRMIVVKVHGKSTEKHREDHYVAKKEPTFWEKNAWLKYTLIGLLLILLGYGIYAAVSEWYLETTPWPFGGKTSVKTENTNADPNQNLGQPSQNNAALVDSAAIRRNHDIDYLKRENYWRKDSLQSPEFQSLHNAITSGNINEVVKLNDELFVEGVKVNGFYAQFVDGLQHIISLNDQAKESASRVMKENNNGSSINLQKMSSGIILVVKEHQHTSPLMSEPN